MGTYDATSIEDIDLTTLAAELRDALGRAAPEGYLRGKAFMRDMLVHERGYSELEAEELIDTLELNGYLHFLGDPSRRSGADTHWDIGPPPGVLDDQ